MWYYIAEIIKYIGRLLQETKVVAAVFENKEKCVALA
jgi:hypothetical protein